MIILYYVTVLIHSLTETNKLAYNYIANHKKPRTHLNTLLR